MYEIDRHIAIALTSSHFKAELKRRLTFATSYKDVVELILVSESEFYRLQSQDALCEAALPTHDMIYCDKMFV